MKVIFDRKTLAETLARVTPLAQSRTPKPILRNILLDSGANGDNETVFSATNLEQALRVNLLAKEVSQPGQCLLNADRMSAIVKSATGDTVELATDDSGVNIKSGRGKWKLNTEDVKDFPAANPGDMELRGEVPAGPLVEALSLAAVCADANSARYALGGVKLSSAGGGAVRVMAADGSRMCVIDLTASTDNFDALVPLPAIRLIERSLLSAGSAKIFTSGSWLKIESAGGSVWTRQLDGQFPQRTIEERLNAFEAGVEFKIPAQLLSNSLQQAVVTVSDDEPAVAFDVGQESLVLGSKATAGATTVDLPITASGDDARWRTRPAYVREFLRLVGDKELNFALGRSDKQDKYPDGFARMAFDSTTYIVGGLPLTENA